jgi:hypothetical protein
MGKMSKNTNYVIVVTSEKGKISSAFQLHNYNNIVTIMQSLTTDPYGKKRCDIEYLCACDTKAVAIATADAWNESLKKKGIFWETGFCPYTSIH